MNDYYENPYAYSGDPASKYQQYEAHIGYGPDPNEEPEEPTPAFEDFSPNDRFVEDCPKCGGWVEGFRHDVTVDDNCDGYGCAICDGCGVLETECEDCDASTVAEE